MQSNSLVDPHSQVVIGLEGVWEAPTRVEGRAPGIFLESTFGKTRFVCAPDELCED